MHGDNARQAGHPGLEYWKSRSNLLFEVPGRWVKTYTHRYERRQAKEIIKEEVEQEFGEDEFFPCIH